MRTALLIAALVPAACFLPGIKAAEPERVCHVNIMAANASDENPGTEASPWKTIAHAGKNAQAGDRIIIHPGVYTGSLSVKNSGTKEKPIVFEGAAPGQVIFDGSEKVAGWKRTEHDSRIWEAACAPKLSKFPPPHAYSKFYNTADPRDLSVDGMPLFFSLAPNLPAGSWGTDAQKGRIYARLPDDDDPNKHAMQVVSTMFAVDLQNQIDKEKKTYPEYIEIRNLHVRRYQGGMRIWGANCTAENNTIEWCEMWGFLLNSLAHDLVLKNNLVQWCGHVGAYGAERIKFINNKILFANWKLSSPGWDASGIKTMNQLDSLYDGNECAYNASLGIWLDTDLQGVVIKNNIVHDNVAAGLEDEASFGNTWEYNLAYRNGVGFYCGNSAKDIIRKNIFADNFTGMHFRFNRSRGSHLLDMPNPEDFADQIKAMRKCNSDERIKKWLDDFLTYCAPCRMVRNNIVENNMFLNNAVEVHNFMRTNLPDPGEAYMIAGNRFVGNIFVNPDPQNVFAGYGSPDDYADKTGDCQNNVYLKAPDIPGLPEWAQSLYAKHAARLKYPRSYMSIPEIYKSLCVRNPNASSYRELPTPAGLLALARICESDIMERIEFADTELHAYRINIGQQPAIVFWREHGRPSDFLPILLEGIPDEATLETAWGLKIPIQRKGARAALNIGTWPVYLRGCPQNVSAVEPFALNIPEALQAGQEINIALHDAIGDGDLYIDAYRTNLICPKKVPVKNGKAAFALTPLPDDSGTYKIRLAGVLGGIYSGKSVELHAAGKAAEEADIVRANGFIPIALQGAANCSLKKNSAVELLQMPEAGASLHQAPENIMVGKIPFAIDKDACLGLASKRIHAGRPAMISIPMNNKKYKALAFLQVAAYAPEKTGDNLFSYRLNYADNFTASANTRNKIHVFDWWDDTEDRPALLMKQNNACLAWSGESGARHTVSIYAYIWENPEPEKEIVALDIGGGDAEKDAILGILAISGLELK